MSTELMAAPRSTFARRLLGAASLSAATYEEVEADRGAIGQAVGIVLLSSLAAGVGARGFGATQPMGIVFFACIALVGWTAWAVLVYQIGARLLPSAQTHADAGELIRTIGFASTPGILRVLGVFPSLTLPVFTVTAIWMLIAMIVAVRQALDYTSTGRAVAVCALGWTLAVTIAIVLGIAFGPHVS